MIYIVLLILSLALTIYIENMSIKKSLVDIPNDRSSHTASTPHGGWIAILGFLIKSKVWNWIIVLQKKY